MISAELSGINKEEILLGWFARTVVKTSDEGVWNCLYFCLNSSHLQDFRQSEINQSVLSKLIKSLTKCLKEKYEIKSYITKCALIILKSSSFKQYFKHNTELYSIFLAAVVSHINEIHELNNVFNDRSIFDQKIFIKIDSCKNFVTNIFPALVNVASELNDENLHNNITNLLQRVSFYYRFITL